MHLTRVAFSIAALLAAILGADGIGSAIGRNAAVSSENTGRSAKNGKILKSSKKSNIDGIDSEKILKRVPSSTDDASGGEAAAEVPLPVIVKGKTNAERTYSKPSGAAATSSSVTTTTRTVGSKKQRPVSSVASPSSSSLPRRPLLTVTNVVIPVRKEAFAAKAMRGVHGLTDTLRKGAESAVDAVEKASRRVKSYLSSDFEALLLQLTKPDDERPQQGDVSRFLATTASFVHNDDLRDEMNPYRVTLRKLWAKIAEPDARTALKALQLLHALLRSAQTSAEDARIYRALLRRMRRSEQSEKTHCAYFDLRTAREKYVQRSSSGSESRLLEGIVQRYCDFVMLRSSSFLGNFAELSAIDYSMPAKEICKLMDNAMSLLQLGLDCRVSSEEESEVVMCCLELVARDVIELLQQFAAKARWLSHEHEVGDVFEKMQQQQALRILSSYRQFYEQRYKEIAAFIEEVADALELYEIHIPNTLPLPADHLKSLPAADEEQR